MEFVVFRSKNYYYNCHQKQYHSTRYLLIMVY